MITSTDPATLRRIAAECREDDRRLGEVPWEMHRTRVNLPTIARALEAAAEMAEQHEAKIGIVEFQRDSFHDCLTRARADVERLQGDNIRLTQERHERVGQLVADINTARAEIEAVKHILGAEASGETLRMAAERVELSRANRTYERDAARSEVDQLRAENKRLAALAAVSPDDIAAVVAENDRMHAAFDRALKTLHGDKPHVLSVACTWCGQHWPKLAGESYEETRRHTNAHAEICPANEIRIERDRLREQVHVLTAANRAAELRMSLAIDERNRFESAVDQLRSDSERRIDALVQDVRQAQYERDRAQGASNSTALHRCARCNAYLTSSDDASAVDAALAAHRTICPDPSP